MLAVLMAAAGCSRPDPVLGKWTFTVSGVRQSVTFHQDGTAAVDVEALEKRLDARPVRRPVPANVRAAVLDRLRNARINWKKTGSLYQLRAQLQSGAPPPIIYAKLAGDNLVFCDQNGRAITGPRGVRTP
jgi:hypothetical protein